jgi:hypothetical protein
MLAITQGLIRYLLKWFQIPRAQYSGLISSYSNVATPTAGTLTVAGTTIVKFWAHCLHTDGNIYYPPYSNNSGIAIYNTTSNTMSTVSWGLSGLGTTGNYNAAVLHPNGKIYCPPLAASNVLIIDPANATTQLQSYGLTFSGSSQYNAAILGPDNKIYCVGTSTGGAPSTCLVIDPVANTAIRTSLGNTMPSIGSTQYPYIGAVTSVKNNKLYFGNYNNANWLVIDTVSQTANTQTWGGTGGQALATQQTQGLCNTVNGNIVATPHGSGTPIFQQVDPVANTRSTYTAAQAGNAYKTVGAVLGPDGFVYAAGYGSTAAVLRFDPVAGTANSSAYGQTVNSGPYGGQLAPNGKIIFSPSGGTNPNNLLVLSVNGTGNSETNFASTCQSPYLNKTN